MRVNLFYLSLENCKSTDLESSNGRGTVLSYWTGHIRMDLRKGTLKEEFYKETKYNLQWDENQ